MKYYIVHTQQTETGETHEKWIPSAHYQLSAEYLLEQMEAQPDRFDFLLVPFILTLCAGLEANLNDWLIVDVQTISMRAMKNKWASYTKRTHLLIFNTELLNLDEDLGDYVIVHELLHFRVPNHGKLWKSLMRAHLSDYEKQEERLEQIAPRVKGEW